MLIISKEKNRDYYDGVAGTVGIDKTIIYKREIKEFTKNEIPSPFKHTGSNYYIKQIPSFLRLGGYSIKKEHKKIYEGYSYFIIGFCGKLYIGWRFYINNNNLNKKLSSIILYDFNQIKELLDYKQAWCGNLEDHAKNVLDYDALELFRKFNTPVFIYDHDYDRKISISGWYENPRFIINPVLNDYEFYRVFDTFQTFQEIQMFLGGVLGNHEKKIIEVADKYKIEQHGFDKWSFRKEKGFK